MTHAKVAPASEEALESLATQPHDPARAAEPVQEPRLRQRPAKHPARAAPDKTSAPKAATPEDGTPTRLKAFGETVTMVKPADDARRTATAVGLVLAVLAVGVVFVGAVRDRL